MKVAKLESIESTFKHSIIDSNSEHLSIVMVGDTGFAPSGAAPLPDRVHKYGRSLSFTETLNLIRPAIDGHVNFANIETVISASTSLKPYPKKYNFVTHPNGIEQLVKAGFNLFSLANNHSFDYGKRGVLETLAHANAMLDKGLLAHAGIGKTHWEAAHAPVFSSNNFALAFGAIGIGAGGGGIQRANAARPGQLNLYDAGDRSALTNSIKKSQADIRLLSVHLGRERVIRPSRHEAALLRALGDAADADVVIGHHAHVARGLEIRAGRLIVYGLGNFNHQGTANMNTHGGCRDFSLMIKAHFVRETGQQAVLAAIEALPIQSTHIQPKRLSVSAGASRISVLNGLANQFDNPANDAMGIRFVAQSDGSGLHCLPTAQNNAFTRQLCSNYDPSFIASRKAYQRAVSTCGRIAPKKMIAKAKVQKPAVIAKALPAAPFKLNALRSVSNETGFQPVSQIPRAKEIHVAALSKVVSARTSPLILSVKSAGADMKIPDAKEAIVQVSKFPHQLKRNPDHWPTGMPRAWVVPERETASERKHRWKQQHWSVAEVEQLLRKKGLIQ